MKIKIGVIILITLGHITSYGQTRECIGKDFVITSPNRTISVGDIYVKSKDGFTKIISREGLLSRSKSEKLFLDTTSINNCDIDITKSYKAELNINAPVSKDIYAKIAAKASSMKSAKMRINEGYKVSLKGGVIEFTEILDLLEINVLENLLSNIKKGSKAVLITETVYLEDAFTEIDWNKDPELGIIGKVDTINGKFIISIKNEKHTRIDYNSDISVGYLQWAITKKEITKAICRKDGGNEVCINHFYFAPFGIKQFKNNQKALGCTFVASQVAVPAIWFGGFYCKALNSYGKYENKTALTLEEHNKYFNDYKKNRSVAIWGAVGVGVFIYGINILCNYYCTKIEISSQTFTDSQGNLGIGMSIGFKL